MRHAILFAIPLVLVVMSARAQQADDPRIRERAGAIRAEAAKLAESGRREEASRLVAIADDLTAIADHHVLNMRPPGPESELDSLRDRLIKTIQRQKELSRSLRNRNDPALQKVRHDIVEIL